MSFLHRVLQRLKKRRSAEQPCDLRDLRGADPCWCGSGRPYRRCHRAEDRRRLAEALGKGGGAGREAFL